MNAIIIAFQAHNDSFKLMNPTVALLNRSPTSVALHKKAETRNCVPPLAGAGKNRVCWLAQHSCVDDHGHKKQRKVQK